MQNRTLIAVASLVIVTVLAWTVFSQSRKVDDKVAWEYKAFTTNVSEDRQINEHANAGWELVTATAVCPDDSGCSVAVYLKRRK